MADLILHTSTWRGGSFSFRLSASSTFSVVVFWCLLACFVKIHDTQGSFYIPTNNGRKIEHLNRDCLIYYSKGKYWYYETKCTSNQETFSFYSSWQQRAARFSSPGRYLFPSHQLIRGCPLGVHFSPLGHSSFWASLANTSAGGLSLSKKGLDGWRCMFSKASNNALKCRHTFSRKKMSIGMLVKVFSFKSVPSIHSTFSFSELKFKCTISIARGKHCCHFPVK